MNIFIYCPSARGGHARYAREFLTALAEVGPGLDVCASLVTSFDLDDEYQSSRYAIHRILPKLRVHDQFANSLHRAVSRVAHYTKREQIFLEWFESRRDQVHAIHFQEYTPWLAARHFSKLKCDGVRLFYTVHNIHPNESKFLGHRMVYNHWNRTAWRLCNGLFVHTAELKRQLAEFLGPGHPEICVTPHGVWTNACRAPSCRSRPASPRRLLYFGVIRQNKGLQVLLAAMGSLPGYKLTIAGQPQDHKYCEMIRRAAYSLPAGRVNLICRFIEENEMCALFDDSDAVILPYTTFSSQSGVLHDALAFGLPVVVSDVGALGESVREWEIGQIVRPNDPGALASAIQALFIPQTYQATIQAIDRARTRNSWLETAKASIVAYLQHSPLRSCGQ